MPILHLPSTTRLLNKLSLGFLLAATGGFLVVFNINISIFNGGIDLLPDSLGFLCLIIAPFCFLKARKELATFYAASIWIFLLFQLINAAAYVTSILSPQVHEGITGVFVGFSHMTALLSFTVLGYGIAKKFIPTMMMYWRAFIYIHSIEILSLVVIGIAASISLKKTAESTATEKLSLLLDKMGRFGETVNYFIGPLVISIAIFIFIFTGVILQTRHQLRKQIGAENKNTLAVNALMVALLLASYAVEYLISTKG